MTGTASERKGTRRPRGIVEAVFAAYPRFRESMARQLEERPGESRLLAYAMGVCLALFLGRLPALLYAPRGSLEGGLAAHVTMSLVSILFFLPLFLYGVAALVGIVARAFGGTGGWYETRLATFWGLLVAAPLQLTAALASNALSLTGVSVAGIATSVAAGLVAAWIWAACLAEAHGFRHTGAVFAAMFVALNAAFLLIVAATGG
jgi:hypothetical protein